MDRLLPCTQSVHSLTMQCFFYIRFALADLLLPATHLHIRRLGMSQQSSQDLVLDCPPSLQHQCLCWIYSCVWKSAKASQLPPDLAITIALAPLCGLQLSSKLQCAWMPILSTSCCEQSPSMANSSTDTALFADDATEPSYRNKNYVAYATTAYKVSITIDATPPCSRTVYWWCLRADAITSGKSHSIQSDIAGYYSWISTKIVSRVSVAYIFSCQGSEPVDRLLPLLHVWRMCCCSCITSCVSCCCPPQIVAATTLSGLTTSPLNSSALDGLPEGRC